MTQAMRPVILCGDCANLDGIWSLSYQRMGARLLQELFLLLAVQGGPFSSTERMPGLHVYALSAV